MDPADGYADDCFAVTAVPGEFLDWLDSAPYVPNEPLQRAAARARTIFQRTDDKMPG